MDHSEAQQSHAVERYLLNEMTGGERDGFEEHFFDCRLCAEDVTDGVKLVAAGRRVALNSPQVVPMPRRWTAWLSAAAAAVIVNIAVVGGWMLRGPSPSLAIVEDHQIDMSVSRGTGAEATVINGKNAILYVTIEDLSYPSYEILIRDAGGKIVTTTPVTARQAADQIPLLLRSLPAGSYVLAIEGVRN